MLYHIELNCPSANDDGYELTAALRTCIGEQSDSLVVSHRVGTDVIFDEIHGVEGGICFGVMGQSRASATHQALRKSEALRALLAAFPEAELQLTEPWLEWSSDISTETLIFTNCQN